MFTSASVSLSVPPEMATCASFLSQTRVRTITTGWPSARRLGEKHKLRIFESKYPTAGSPSQCQPVSVQITASHNFEFSSSDASLPRNSADIVEVARNVKLGVPNTLKTSSEITQRLVLADIDPGTAKVAIGIVGPFLSAFGFLFIIRIVMSWYPKLPVGKFPYVIAYAPTEPLLIPTRRLIPPLGGVDVTPVVWFGLLSFLNEILVGPQGLLVLLSQQVS